MALTGFGRIESFTAFLLSALLAGGKRSLGFDVQNRTWQCTSPMRLYYIEKGRRHSEIRSAECVRVCQLVEPMEVKDLDEILSKIHIYNCQAPRRHTFPILEPREGSELEVGKKRCLLSLFELTITWSLYKRLVSYVHIWTVRFVYFSNFPLISANCGQISLSFFLSYSRVKEDRLFGILGMFYGYLSPCSFDRWPVSFFSSSKIKYEYAGYLKEMVY